MILLQIFKEVGLPDGVLNLVCGTGQKVGEVIVGHPDVRVVSFTGSTAIGRRIAQGNQSIKPFDNNMYSLMSDLTVASPMMKKLSLELGGKNAALVFADAKLEVAVQTLIRGAFMNQGEICLCTSRIYVQDSIYDAFVKRFVEIAKTLKVGDPTDPQTFYGAMNSKVHLDKVISYGELAKVEGGKIHCGFGVDSSMELPEKYKGGYFFPPTVVTDLPKDARCMKEEIFGPIVCIAKFTTEQEAIELANDVEYGLCASGIIKSNCLF